MKFSKDILMLDFEGLLEPKQIGAVLLGRETLTEKTSYCSYIYTDMKGVPSLRSGITQDMLDGAPSQAEVGKIVFEKFGTDIFVGSFVADSDFRHFKTIVSAAGIDPRLYDYHFIDVWPIAYSHLVKTGYEGGFHSDEIFEKFGIPPRGHHNALEDARIASDILRKVMFG